MIFAMSSRLGIGDQLQEAIEQVARVVGTGPALGVVLDRAAGHVVEHEALHSAVVEVQVGELGGTEVRVPADRLVALDPRAAVRRADREAMVLGGDVDPARLEVLDRMVGAAVPERELEGVEPYRATEELMAEADPHDGPLAHHSAHRLDDVLERRRIAGTVGEEDEVRVAGEDILRAAAAGQQGETATPLAELPNDRELDPSIDPHHVRAVARELDRCLRRHGAREVGAGHRRLRVDTRPGVGLRGLGREDPAPHRAAIAGTPQAASQSSQPPSASAQSSPFFASRMITARAWGRSDSMAPALTP